MAADFSAFRIGARGSPLSLAQTGLVRDALAAANPGRVFEIIPITTTGDRIQDRPLIDAGGKGLFTKELDEALLDGRIDLAVHSMKDLPTQLPDGIALVCTPAREDPRDALICAKAETLPACLTGRGSAPPACAGSRRCWLRTQFRDRLLRGNVDTRLRKVASGEVDATLLALSGLRRLGLADHARALIDPVEAPPAAGQGALAITARPEDAETLAALAPLEHRATRLEISAERAFLAALDGSCRTPIAALGRWSEGQLWFIGEFLSDDGAQRWRRIVQEPCATEAEAEALGARLGEIVRGEANGAL